MSILETDQWARRYLPSLVADKVASGMIDRLAEHRYVSIVFLVQQVHLERQPLPFPLPPLSASPRSGCSSAR